MTNQEILSALSKINVYKTKLAIFLKNHCSALFAAIFENTKFLDDNNPSNWKITFQERLYCIENNITERRLCKICKKNIVPFRTDSRSYRKHCCVSCSNLDHDVDEKKKKTKFDKHGDQNYVNVDKSRATRKKNNKNGSWHSNDFSSKVKATKSLKYGNPNYSNIEKRRTTCIERYGVDHHMKCKSVVDNAKKKFADSHGGITSVFLLPEVREKAKTGNRKKSWKHILKSQLVEPLFTLEDYLKIDDPAKCNDLKFKCKKCGTEFNSNWNNGTCKLCPTCYPELHGISHMELDVYDFLVGESVSSKSIEVFNKTKLNRSIVAPKELDIVICRNGIPVSAIEFDGLYWHSELAGNLNNSQLAKTLACENNNIQLIHIFENEWIAKQDIVKSRLKNLLGVYNRVIYARKCEVREVDQKTSKDFQEVNHIQGAVNAKVNLGLYFNDELVALMTFSKARFDKKHEWEMLRFCTKLGHHIPGGAGKLLKHFERSWNPKSIVSYADRRWSRGKLYEALGFKLDHASGPNYWYLKPMNTSQLFNRTRFQKHKLANQLDTFDPGLSEVENMRNNGYTRIFDCGNLVYEKTY